MSVSSVALIRPPITTVARGFWSSAPVPVASAIGTNPSDATSAGFGPSSARSSTCVSSPRCTARSAASRPTGPAPDPDRTYSRHELVGGQHLVDIHDHLRAELAQVQDLVEQVAAGSMGVGAARSHINTMTMRQNN